MHTVIITVNHVFEVGPILAAFLETLTMASFESLKQDIADLKAAVATEKAQGDDRERRLADLEAQLRGGLTEAQAAEIQADIDELKDEIAGIVPDVPTGPTPDVEPAP